MGDARSMRSRDSLRALGVLVLFSSVLLVYLPAIGGGFVWDDDFNVTANPALRDLSGLGRIWTENTVPPYYPLYHSVLWAAYQLWGLEALGYHLLNVVLHAINALLVWRLLSRLEVRAAWAAAALFALHPVQVETVAWVTELKNVLSTTFYLGAMSCYLTYVGVFRLTRGSAGGKGRYRAALFLFLCALLTKTMTVTLPVALLLILWWKRGALGRRELLPTLPFFALGLALGSVTAWSEKYVVGATGTYWTYSPVERLLIAGRALWFYAGKLLWPEPIVFVYPRWTIDTSAVTQYLFPAAAAILIGGLWKLRPSIGRGPLASVLFFVVTLSPALGFFDVFYARYSLVADRWQYLACTGLFAGLAAGARRAADRFGRLGSALGGVALAGALVWLGSLTWSESTQYRDAETLWRATLAESPEAFAAHNNLGGMLLARGDVEEAESHFREAIRLQPDFPEAHNNLGIVLQNRGHLDDAVAEYREAIRLYPAYADAQNNLGIALAAGGDLAAAVECFETAIRLRPDFVNALRNLGTGLLYLGRPGEAATRFERAVELDPSSAEGFKLLGDARAAEGRGREAAMAYREALRLAPESGWIALELAWVLSTSPDPSVRDGDEAVRLAEGPALSSGGESPRALDVLAAAYAEAGRFDSAVIAATEALEDARRSGDQALASEIASRLESYRNGVPHRTSGLD